jgi:hypothetical protein
MVLMDSLLLQHFGTDMLSQKIGNKLDFTVYNISEDQIPAFHLTEPLDTVTSKLMKLAWYLYHFVSETVLQLLPVTLLKVPSIEVLLIILMFFV